MPFGISVFFLRRRRDLNPRAAINDLHPFQGCPFGQLGYFSTLLESMALLASLFIYCASATARLIIAKSPGFCNSFFILFFTILPLLPGPLVTGQQYFSFIQDASTKKQWHPKAPLFIHPVHLQAIFYFESSSLPIEAAHALQSPMNSMSCFSVRKPFFSV